MNKQSKKVFRYDSSTEITAPLKFDKYLFLNYLIGILMSMILYVYINRHKFVKGKDIFKKHLR